MKIQELYENKPFKFDSWSVRELTSAIFQSHKKISHDMDRLVAYSKPDRAVFVRLGVSSASKNSDPALTILKIATINRESDVPDKLTVTLVQGGYLRVNDTKIDFKFKKFTGSPSEVVDYLKKYFKNVKTIIKKNYKDIS